ncbi:MAG: PQQ-binding-like beta-propeller repeat protein [Planctomycetales bacterium]|nr:PQQ-binding-like beta-propeller repeat protein [Planctomycetales bacterium]
MIGFPSRRLPNQLTCRLACLLIMSMAFVPARGKADDAWREWRGDGQGHSNAKDVPFRWSESDVAWRTPIEGLGWSTPVVANGKVWLTTAVDTRSSKEEADRRRKQTTNSQPLIFSSRVSYRAVCIDLATGKIQKDLELFAEEEPQFIQIDNSYATPSPVLEGAMLYCHFGAGGMVALNTETDDVVWTNKSLKVQHENGPGSSPVLWKDLLIVHCDGIDQQYIVALNKSDGKIAWKTARTGELNENPQLRKSYATPLIVEIDGKPQLISPAADWLYGYDPANGKELWKLAYGKLGFSNSARPVAGHGLIYICTGFMQSQLLAVKAPSNGQPAEIAWKYDKQVPAVSSPVLVGDELYFASGNGIVSCLDAKSGKVHWTQRVGTRIWASPIFADGRLYFLDQKGAATVIAPGTTYRELATNQVDGRIQTAAVAVDGALLLRTDQALYRVSN